jgi:hypothetical protein
MGGCPPSLWHRFQRYTLSGERFDFVRWVTPGSRLLFTQRVHLMGSRVHGGHPGLSAFAIHKVEYRQVSEITEQTSNGRVGGW